MTPTSPHRTICANPSGAALRLRPARASDAPFLARLMTDDFEGSRLTNLGPRFVLLLNRHMATSRHCVCLVAERDGTLQGGAAVAASTRDFYREFLIRKGLLCALVVLPRLLKPANLRTALKGLSYFPHAPAGDPEAELISFVVSADAARSGIGTALFRGLVERLESHGIREFKIITSTDNQAANAFYSRQGCQRLRTERFYRDTRVNVYVHRSA